jgi:hypothetical protein
MAVRNYAVFMKLTRSICHYDYPAKLTSQGEPANKSCCVLACVQMQVEAITGETYLETDFYHKMLSNRLIREDGYINNYDDILRLVLIDRKEFQSQANVIAAIKACSVRFSIYHKMQLTESSANAGDLVPPIPIIGYLANRHHAVLIVAAAKSEAGEVALKVIDPKFRGEKARQVLPLAAVRKFGVFQ